MINRRESRKAFNIAVVKKGSLYDIVRFTNGFDNEPITLLPNIEKNEIEAKLERAIHLVAATSQEWGVIITPQDRNDIVRLVLMLEDSGINSSDITAQKNGMILFNHRSDDMEKARKDIENFLKENNYIFNEDTVSITRPFTGKVEEISTVEQEPVELKKEEVKPTTASVEDRDKITYEALNKYPELLDNPELKTLHASLEQKFAKQVQLPPSINATDMDNTVITDSIKQNNTDAYIKKLDNKIFASIDDFIKDANDNGVSMADFIKYAKDNPDVIIKRIQ